MNELAKPEQVQEMVLAQIGTREINWSATPVPLQDVIDEIAPRGDKAKLREFVGKMITIWSVQPFKSRYGLAVWVLFTDEDGALYNTIVSGKVVMPKLILVADRLPVKAQVVWVEGGSYEGYFDLA